MINKTIGLAHGYPNFRRNSVVQMVSVAAAHMRAYLTPGLPILTPCCGRQRNDSSPQFHWNGRAFHGIAR